MMEENQEGFTEAPMPEREEKSENIDNTVESVESKTEKQ